MRQNTMHGETSRTMFCRGNEQLKSLDLKSKHSVLWSHCVDKHLKSLDLKSKDSVLRSHCVEKHDGDNVLFQMKATGYFCEPLTRQGEEAVRIFHTRNPINRKGEWKKTAIPRATYARK